MERVGTYDAKNRLSELLDKVARGEEIIITRNGKPVARLVQPEAGLSEEERSRARKAADEIRQLRKSVKPLGDIGIKELIDEGRRF